MILLFGNGSYLGATYEVENYTCPFCQHRDSTDLFIYSNYFHLFYIPFIPISKTGAALCSACNQMMDHGRLSPRLLDEFAEHEKKYRHPYKVYLGSIIFFGIPGAAVAYYWLYQLV